MTNPGASSFSRFASKISGPSLDDARNRQALEQLARSVRSIGPLRTPSDTPEVLASLRIHSRELVAYMSWIELQDRGLRVFVVTNNGHAPSPRPYTILPCQTVAVVLPNAAVGHVLTLLSPYLDTPIAYPHISVAGHVQPETFATFADRLWTLHGYPQPPLHGLHHYRFAGCVDGILYAISMSPSFDRHGAMAAVEELLLLAAQPWQPPSPQALAAMASASAATRRSVNRTYLVAVILVFVIMVPMAICSIDVVWRLLQ